MRSATVVRLAHLRRFHRKMPKKKSRICGTIKQWLLAAANGSQFAIKIRKITVWREYSHRTVAIQTCGLCRCLRILGLWHELPAHCPSGELLAVNVGVVGGRECKYRFDQ